MGIEDQELINKQMLIDDTIGRKILDAAMAIIDTEGYDNLTIRKVAKISGCSNTAIYIRFEDKEALTRAVAELRAKPFLMLMDENYVRTEDFFSNIKRMTNAALEKVYEMDMGSVNLQMYYRSGMTPGENPFVIKLIGYIQHATNRGEIRSNNIEMLAFVLESSFWGVAYMLKNSEGRGVSLEQAKKILEYSNNLHFAGIRIKDDEDIFWDLLKERNVDVDKALERMKGNKEVYKDFLTEFFEDPDITDLQDAIEAGNAREAFEYAHGLKGMAANLGLDEVHENLSVLVEILRPGGLNGAKEAYEKVVESCQTIMQIL